VIKAYDAAGQVANITHIYICESNFECCVKLFYIRTSIQTFTHLLDGPESHTGPIKSMPDFNYHLWHAC